MSRPVVATLTLGCKLNQAESQAFGRQLQAAGCDVIDRPAPADAYLINTCTITHVADRKARRLIRMAKRLAPDAPVVVTGCYADWAADQIRRQTGAERVIDNSAKQEAPAALLALLDLSTRLSQPASPPPTRHPTPGRTRAFIKIQEGCDDVCAFCIVPAVRGRERARPIDEIVREAQTLEAAGALEIVLTGTQPGAYGRDRDDGTNAARLLETLLAQTNLPRIRYSSIQPQDVSDEFLRQWEDGRLCRHFHLALQSGSNRVLRRMRRRYDTKDFALAVERVRAAVPGAAITTDLIAGFPAETAVEHDASMAFAREIDFATVHVFPYSARPRTTAGLLEDDVTPQIKRERVGALRSLAESGTARFRSALVGSVQPILIEARGERECWMGLTDSYVPVELTAPAVPDLSNRLLPVRIVATGNKSPSGALRGCMLG